MPRLSVTGNGNGGALSLVDASSRNTINPSSVLTPTTLPVHHNPPSPRADEEVAKPQPPPPPIEDVDFDPDNMVIRGAPLDDSSDEHEEEENEAEAANSDGKGVLIGGGEHNNDM